MLSKLQIMKTDVDFDEEPTDEEGKEQRPVWMATLQGQCQTYQALLKVTFMAQASQTSANVL